MKMDNYFSLFGKSWMIKNLRPYTNQKHAKNSRTYKFGMNSQ